MVTSRCSYCGVAVEGHGPCLLCGTPVRRHSPALRRGLMWGLVLESYLLVLVLMWRG